MASPSGTTMPKPGAFVTPQAREGLARFFDPATYHGKMVGLPALGERQLMTELTQQNINRFFDVSTYHGKTLGLPPMGPCICKTGMTKESLAIFFDPAAYHGQKRAAESPLPHPAAKARMGKMELIEKFKLAAQMNGVSWDDIAVP